MSDRAYCIDLRVYARATDAVSFTALETLRKDMGYGDRVAGLSRALFYRIQVTTDGIRAAKELGVELAEKTKLFVNPTKEWYKSAVLDVRDRDIDPLEGPGAATALDETTFRLELLVCLKEDTRAGLILRTLRETLGYGSTIGAISRGAIWALDLRAKDAAAALTTAAEIGTTKSIGRGLLANPHAQEIMILGRGRDAPRIVPKPWGYERWWAFKDDKYAGKLIFVKAGTRTSLQYHRKKHETMYFASGEGLLEIGDTRESLAERLVTADSTVAIPPGKVHRLTAITDVTFFECSTPDLDDVVRLEDDFNRKMR